MSVAVATLARIPCWRITAAIRCATARVAVPIEERHCSASTLASAATRTITQVSRCPAYGGVPISVSYTRG